MTSGTPAVASNQSAPAVRVGLFGNLGSGNIGNDASMEAVLGYLKDAHPDMVVDAMCGGPERVRDRYGVSAIPLFWYQKHEQHGSPMVSMVFKALGKGIDVFRMASWVRRHDAIIVPGMGVLEASLPLRPWGFPYAMFMLSAWGKVFRTKVALVSVGAGVINQRMTRWLFDAAARLAFYRSYRNSGSRDAMLQRGVDTADDHVYPDLAFALPVPSDGLGNARAVCVGVMAYHGSNDDRKNADEIYSTYVAAMKCFIRWLVDDGRTVRLLVGDTNGSDDRVVREILADLRKTRPDLESNRVVAEPIATFADVMESMVPVASVVAIRFHNVLAGLKLCKPTIAISYSAKHDALMADMGLPEFCQPVSVLDVDLLIKRFRELEDRSVQVRETLVEHNAKNQQLLSDQFTELSTVLFPGVGSAPSRPLSLLRGNQHE